MNSRKAKTIRKIALLKWAEKTDNQKHYWKNMWIFFGKTPRIVAGSYASGFGRFYRQVLPADETGLCGWKIYGSIIK